MVMLPSACTVMTPVISMKANGSLKPTMSNEKLPSRFGVLEIVPIKLNVISPSVSIPVKVEVGAISPVGGTAGLVVRLIPPMTPVMLEKYDPLQGPGGNLHGPGGNARTNVMLPLSLGSPRTDAIW